MQYAEGEGCVRPPNSLVAAHTPHTGTQDQTRWTPSPLRSPTAVAYGLHGWALDLTLAGTPRIGRDTSVSHIMCTQMFI